MVWRRRAHGERERETLCSKTKQKKRDEIKSRAGAGRMRPMSRDGHWTSLVLPTRSRSHRPRLPSARLFISFVRPFLLSYNPPVQTLHLPLPPSPSLTYQVPYPSPPSAFGPYVVPFTLPQPTGFHFPPRTTRPPTRFHLIQPPGRHDIQLSPVIGRLCNRQCHNSRRFQRDHPPHRPGRLPLTRVARGGCLELLEEHDKAEERDCQRLPSRER